MTDRIITTASVDYNEISEPIGAFCYCRYIAVIVIILIHALPLMSCMTIV